MSRRYEETHPWITFTFGLGRLGPEDWMRLGEALSKCDHIAGTPLTPAVADQLHRVFLAKGIHATTQIEGNTLSEEEVLKVVQGELKLPPSQEYLQIEVENILRACEMIVDDLSVGRDMTVTPERIELFNRMVLEGLPPQDGVTPGKIRDGSVLVGSVYRGAPAEDCDYLLVRLCDWLRSLHDDPAIPPAYRRPVQIISAVLAHLYIAWIHPFRNGNGRTARLVEFQLLLSAGLPTPACHLLSNFYNRTRSRYYQVLGETSREPSHPVERFVAYALGGFIDELREQLQVIRGFQVAVAWVNFVHHQFRGADTEARVRQRDLVLELPNDRFVPVDEVRHLTSRLAERYAGKQPKTITRDLNSLAGMGLIERSKKGVRAQVELMSAFLPARREDPR